MSWLSCECGEVLIGDLDDEDTREAYYRARVWSRTMNRMESASVNRCQIITLSRPNVPAGALGDELSILRRNAREFFHEFLDGEGVTGVIAVMEIVYSPSVYGPMAHPHVHMIGRDCTTPWGKAWDVWEGINGGRYQVDFSRDESSRRYQGWRPTSKAATSYALKYILKGRRDANYGRKHRYTVLGDWRMPARSPSRCQECDGEIFFCPGEVPLWSVLKHPEERLHLVGEAFTPIVTIPWRRKKGKPPPEGGRKPV
jgi:hypothetical protein